MIHTPNKQKIILIRYICLSNVQKSLPGFYIQVPYVWSTQKEICLYDKNSDFVYVMIVEIQIHISTFIHWMYSISMSDSL